MDVYLDPKRRCKRGALGAFMALRKIFPDAIAKGIVQAAFGHTRGECRARVRLWVRSARRAQTSCMHFETSRLAREFLLQAAYDLIAYKTCCEGRGLRELRWFWSSDDEWGA